MTCDIRRVLTSCWLDDDECRIAGVHGTSRIHEIALDPNLVFTVPLNRCKRVARLRSLKLRFQHKKSLCHRIASAFSSETEPRAEASDQLSSTPAGQKHKVEHIDAWFLLVCGHEPGVHGPEASCV